MQIHEINKRHQNLLGPLAASKASFPIKKSRSSVPRFWDKLPPEVPCPLPPVDWRVAIVVGKIKEGESLPAKPSLVKPVPLR